MNKKDDDIAEWTDERLIAAWEKKWDGSKASFCQKYSFSISTFKRWKKGGNSPKARNAVISYLSTVMLDTSKSGTNDSELVPSKPQTPDKHEHQPSLVSNHANVQTSEVPPSSATPLPLETSSTPSISDKNGIKKESIIAPNSPEKVSQVCKLESSAEKTSPKSKRRAPESKRSKERAYWFIRIQYNPSVKNLPPKQDIRLAASFLAKLRVVQLEKSALKQWKDKRSLTSLSYCHIDNSLKVHTLVSTELEMWTRFGLFSRVMDMVQVSDISITTPNVVYAALFQYVQDEKEPQGPTICVEEKEGNVKYSCRLYIGSAEKGIKNRWFDDGSSHCRQALRAARYHSKLTDTNIPKEESPKKNPTLCDTLLASVEMHQVLVIPFAHCQKKGDDVKQIEGKWIKHFDCVEGEEGLNMRYNSDNQQTK